MDNSLYHAGHHRIVMIIDPIRPQPARRSLHLRLRPLGRNPEVPHRPVREEARKDDDAYSMRRLRVQHRGLLRASRPEPPGCDVVRVGPRGVREESVEPRNGRRAPEVGRRPAVGEEFGGRGDHERVGVEGEEVREEEPPCSPRTVDEHVMSMCRQDTEDHTSLENLEQNVVNT